MNQANEKTPQRGNAEESKGNLIQVPVYRTAPAVTSRFKKWLANDRRERSEIFGRIASSIIIFAFGYYSRFVLEAMHHVSR